MSRLFIKETIPIGDAARTEMQAAADAARNESIGPVERITGLANERQSLGIERLDGDRVSAEVQRQAEAEQHRAASADITVERFTGEPSR